MPPDPPAHNSDHCERLLLREIANLEKTLVTRIAAIEHSVVVAHDDMVRVPTQVDRAVAALHDLTWARFDDINRHFSSIEHLRDTLFGSVDTRIKERDVRVDQLANVNKAALDAALISADRAATKQTESFAKQIEQIMTMVHSITASTDSKVGDLKDRVMRIEGRGAGHTETWGYVIGALGILAGILVAIVTHVIK